MRNVEMDRENISIRMMIIGSFILLMLTTVGLIGYIVLSHEQRNIL